MLLKTIKILLVIILILLIIYRLGGIELFQNDENHIYLFWTGGFDSTFRLCQAVLDEDKRVTPIYISFKDLDNLPNKTYKRKNLIQEIKSMKKILQKIKKGYPKKANNINKIIIIPNINYKKDILESMRNLWIQKKNHRPLSQYGGLAQVCQEMNKNIEIAVENSPHSTMRKMVKNHLTTNSNGYKVLNKDCPKDLKIFDKFVFSTINLSKKDMLKISEKNGYKNIMDITWSCWFPKKGKACGRCPMCTQRIIPSPNLN